MTRTLCVLAIAALLAGGCTERQSAPPPAGAPAGSESAAGALRLTVAAVTAALTCTLVAAGPAVAAPADRGVDAAKRAVTARIDKRLAALEGFTTTLASAKQVQAPHRTVLTELITTQTTGLTVLRAKVQQETTREALRADARSMVTDYRVFLLTGPKVRLTAAIDTELAAVAELRGKADAAKLDAITATLSGKVDTLLALRPGPDAPALRAAVKPIREAAKSARTDLKALRKTK